MNGMATVSPTSLGATKSAPWRKRRCASSLTPARMHTCGNSPTKRLTWSSPRQRRISTSSQHAHASALRASVIVCTYNRCNSLLDTLQALARQSVRTDASWEIVVVDNNSRDATRTNVERFTAENPQLRIRYVFEGRQ